MDLHGWRRSGFSEVRQLLDHYCPDWLAGAKPVRAAYARTIQEQKPEEFFRWCDLFAHSDPEWLTTGQFRSRSENGGCFPLIADFLASHASLQSQPDDFRGPPSNTSPYDWPRQSYIDVHRNDYSEHPLRLMLQKLLDCTEAGLRNRMISDWNLDALRKLASLSHVGFRGTIGSYTEQHQSDIDAVMREYPVLVEGLAVVLDAQAMQSLATQVLHRQPRR
jgi:hypothetical protein